MAAAAGGGFVGAARAGTIVLLLPTATATPPPPLAGTTTLQGGLVETRVPGRVRNAERVEVGLADDGSPVRVAVTQRLVISQLGDYSFTIPAPATDVVAAPGSRSEPGLRELGIVWQGFSSGRRILAAKATLSPAATVPALPLRISIRRSGGRVRVRLTDVAVRTVLLATGTASRKAVGDFVVRLRAAQSRLRDQVSSSGLFAVTGTPTGQVESQVVAPLRVHGTITVRDRAPVEVSALLGEGHPLTRTISLPTGARPRIALRVELLDPLELLPRPDEVASAHDPLSTLQHALGNIALSWQYRHFLASPDPLGPSRIAYVYRTLAQAQASARPPRDSDDDTLVIVLAAALGTALLAGAVVLWAHS